ncbi:MAG TPA: hypothetical protein VJR23_04790 [Candidatus Acidoferrales bacterium]|nr:hypothetical protein [Candidatus Acidoferrales bacterium]
MNGMPASLMADAVRKQGAGEKAGAKEEAKPKAKVRSKCRFLTAMADSIGRGWVPFLRQDVRNGGHREIQSAEISERITLGEGRGGRGYGAKN